MNAAVTPPTLQTGNPSIDAAIAAALAVAPAAAAANPYVAIGAALLPEVLRFATSFAERQAAGVTSLADCETAVAMSRAALDTFRQHVAAGQPAEKKGG